ncbi:phosphodiesterase [Zwartia panacis]|uniref:phosphodiesterase n=1 Tax=Zwartia panacis TaxID=2683345 RepID=UPI0025B468EE|nr:phosphodiesterase [Zwartia panacis]MDN4016474.1 phosphodiesterase [Zwartia panacis]
MSFTFVQLSDTHIREPGRLAYNRLDTAPYLRNAVQSILSLKQKPLAVVMTGDLTDFGREQEYRHLAELIAPLDMPVYLLPGNHDDRDGLRAAFPAHDYLGESGFVQYEVDIGPLTLMTLDTCVLGESGGELCDERLDWLEKSLDKNAGKPVIVAMHHPPFTTLIGHMDKIGVQRGVERLKSIISRHPNVERIICGHLHRAIDVRFAGTIASTTPSPAHQVTLNLTTDAASTWMLEPPAFRVFGWSPPEGLVTHLAFVGPYEGPYPFRENGKLID